MDGEKITMKTEDMIAELEKICFKNAVRYSYDFEKSIKVIFAEAKRSDEERKTLLWLCYPTGIHCLDEAEVFLEGSPDNLIWRFYNTKMADAEKIAYALKIDGIKDDKVCGVLYELDYEEHCKRVEERAVFADYKRFVYERGSIECSVRFCRHSKEKGEKEFGKFIECKYIPNNPEKLRTVLLTEALLRDAESVRTGLELKEKLQSQWKLDKRELLDGKECRCLCCGMPLDEKLAHNSRTRFADVYICAECGCDEAIKCYAGRRFPNFKEWQFFKEGRVLPEPDNMLLLKHECNFGKVLGAVDPLTKRPEAQIAYSETRYGDYNHHTKWFYEPEAKEYLAKEMECFMDAVLNVPEFRNVRGLKNASCSAELTCDPTEFNLYAETYNLYIWIRLRTGNKGPNLYVRYYGKNKKEVHV